MLEEGRRAARPQLRRTLGRTTLTSQARPTEPESQGSPSHYDREEILVTSTSFGQLSERQYQRETPDLHRFLDFQRECSLNRVDTILLPPIRLSGPLRTMSSILRIDVESWIVSNTTTQCEESRTRRLLPRQPGDQHPKRFCLSDHQTVAFCGIGSWWAPVKTLRSLRSLRPTRFARSGGPSGRS